MKTDISAVGAGVYEPPCMTVVPLRGSGMLCMSAMPKYQMEELWYLNFQSTGDFENGVKTEEGYDDWSGSFW